MSDLSDMLDSMSLSIMLRGKAWADDEEYRNAYLSSAQSGPDSIVGMLSYHIEKSSDEQIREAFASGARIIPPTRLTGLLERLVGKKRPELTAGIVGILRANLRAHKYTTDILFAGLGPGGFTAAQLAEMHAAVEFKITQKLIDRAIPIAEPEQLDAIMAALPIDTKVHITKEHGKSAVMRKDMRIVKWVAERSAAGIDVDLPALYAADLALGTEAKIAEIITYLVDADRYRPTAATVTGMKPGHKKLFTSEFGYSFTAERASSDSSVSDAAFTPFSGEPSRLGTPPSASEPAVTVDDEPAASAAGDDSN